MNKTEIRERMFPHMTMEINSAYCEEFECEDRRYFLYCFEFSCEHSGRTLTWVIRKSLYELQNFLIELGKEFKGKKLEVPKLPARKQFTVLPEESQLSAVQALFTQVIAHPDYSKSSAFIQCLEISANSFTVAQKLKEGYVQKIGSGRQINFSRYYGIYKLFQGRKRKWLRVHDLGIEYSRTHYNRRVAESIAFTPDFCVSKGTFRTGFRDGVRVIGSQHDVVFRTGSTKQRNEFYSAITQAYSASEYSTEDIRFGSSFLIRPRNVCE